MPSTRHSDQMTAYIDDSESGIYQRRDRSRSRRRVELKELKDRPAIANDPPYETPRKEERSRKREKEKQKKAEEEVDEDGEPVRHFVWERGMKIDNDRYTVLSLLGQGTFGRVIECWDSKHNCKVAMKVIRGILRYVENGKIEAHILDKIREKGTASLGANRVIRFCRAFSWNEHYCMVFEVCGLSVYDFLRKNRYAPFRTLDVLTIVQQTLECLRFCHDELNLVHTDLKLENLLFENDEWFHEQRSSRTTFRRPVNASIKVIDFGNGVWMDKEHNSCINTKNYRAPEVLLGMNWDGKSDVWCVGCMAVEMLTGNLLFEPDNEGDHLVMIEKACGAGTLQEILPKACRDIKGKYLREELDDEGSYWRLRSSCSTSNAQKVKPVREYIRRCDVDVQEFIMACLTPDPKQRPSAAELLKHDAFRFLLD